ncbi:hypothetical protein LTR70_005592 [Exophiala xenobiotica]|uniref:Uncharacterized protein n=1 Tax=Lithohypha guttulata TaxID=1690604 RepID=A0ABR0K9A1_9EURO|nr:hypothetical protein LTR24_005340 [Lithohypha guttulata]KAK5318009.1 hypothetical protein LTR70_005592 [Exophiala xenobiotica]
MASPRTAEPAQASPDYIYKIAPATPVPYMSEVEGDKASPILPPSGLDTSSNFIHMSTASQVPGTLGRFFQIDADKRNVVFLLRVKSRPFERQDGVLKWESPDATVCGPRPGEGLFPHLYLDDVNGEADKNGVSPMPEKQSRRLWLRKDEVEGAREVVVDAGDKGGWSEALKALQDWLM